MSKKAIIFTSPTCAPCKQMKPELESILSERNVTFAVVEASFDTQEQFVAYGIRAVPTVVVLRDGTEIGRFTGARSPADIRAYFEGLGL